MQLMIEEVQTMIDDQDQWWMESEEDEWQFEEEIPEWQADLEEKWGLNPGMLEVFLQATAESMYSGAYARM